LLSISSKLIIKINLITDMKNEKGPESLQPTLEQVVAGAQSEGELVEALRKVPGIITGESALYKATGDELAGMVKGIISGSHAHFDEKDGVFKDPHFPDKRNDWVYLQLPAFLVEKIILLGKQKAALLKARKAAN
jgi:hypothetical protein